MATFALRALLLALATTVIVVDASQSTMSADNWGEEVPEEENWGEEELQTPTTPYLTGFAELQKKEDLCIACVGAGYVPF